jgi:hypothetical protein
VSRDLVALTGQLYMALHGRWQELPAEVITILRALREELMRAREGRIAVRPA